MANLAFMSSDPKVIC